MTDLTDLEKCNDLGLVTRAVELAREHWQSNEPKALDLYLAADWLLQANAPKPHPTTDRVKARAGLVALLREYQR